MENAMDLSVPFPVKVKIGPSWGQLVEMCITTTKWKNPSQYITKIIYPNFFLKKNLSIFFFLKWARNAENLYFVLFFGSECLKYQYLLLLDGKDKFKLVGGGCGGDIGTRIGVVSWSEASNVGKSDTKDWLVGYWCEFKRPKSDPDAEAAAVAAATSSGPALCHWLK